MFANFSNQEQPTENPNHHHQRHHHHPIAFGHQHQGHPPPPPQSPLPSYRHPFPVPSHPPPGPVSYPVPDPTPTPVVYPGQFPPHCASYLPTPGFADDVDIVLHRRNSWQEQSRQMGIGSNTAGHSNAMNMDGKKVRSKYKCNHAMP